MLFSFCYSSALLKRVRITSAIFVAIASVTFCGAEASPWAEVGDASLRSDLSVLAAAGVIDNITTQWPLPWAGLLDRLQDEHALALQPSYVRSAARRVLQKGIRAVETDGLRFAASVDGTNLPNVVYGFDGLARQKGEGTLSAEVVDGSTAFRLSLGGRTTETKDHQTLVLDDSYLAQRIGNAVMYGGYVPHWWGPGWISALSLSNNARPIPQVGISRMDTSAFQSSWLSWIGPWQAELFIGLLDGPRINRNTFYVGNRVTFNPIHGLEIGINRTTEICGQGHSCSAASYFQFSNNDATVNQTNDESQIDVRYTNRIGGLPFEVYASVMNEDSSPIVHSVTSHQVGASIWTPIKDDMLRLTAEYTDTVPTVDIFSFGHYFYGDAYNNGGYPDGMRYRGRTLGFSLDSNSGLATLQASLMKDNGVAYTFSYHHMHVSDREISQFSENALQPNIITSAPVLINLGEARISIPFVGGKFDFAMRLQDDQPRPNRGVAASAEMSMAFHL